MGFAFHVIPVLTLALAIFIALQQYRKLSRTPPEFQFPLKINHHKTGPHYYLLLNPFAGQGEALFVLNKILPIFKESNCRFTIVETTHARHAEEILHTMDFDGIDALLAIGGDGTFNEMVNGMLHRKDGKKVPLGIIPSGTGNSMARDLYEDFTNVTAIAQRLVQFNTWEIDYFHIISNGKTLYSINMYGWALAADINQQAENWRFLGQIRYDFASVLEILFSEKHYGIVHLDDHTIEGEITIVIGCNGHYFGAGMMGCPKAKMDDGLTDVWVVQSLSILECFKILLGVFDGSHLQSPYVQYYQVKTLNITDKNPSTVCVDGEVLTKATPFYLRVVPKGITLLH